MENHSGIHPTGRTVLVLLDPVPNYSGAIALTNETINKDQIAQIRATLVEVGPIAWRKDQDKLTTEQLESIRIPVGSRIIMRKFAGEYVTGSDNTMYRIINDDDIWGVIRS